MLLFVISGCATKVENAVVATSSTEPLATISAPPTLQADLPKADLIQSTTQNNLSGNHYLNGSIDLASAHSLDIPLNGTPQWLVSAPYQDGVAFVAVLDTGEVQAFKISNQNYESISITPTQLPAGMPPLLTISGEKIELIVPPADASPLSNSIIVSGKLIYIASNGDLVSVSDSAQARLPINAMPDSRILVDDQNRVLILSGPTDRYDHGILGDAIDASAINLIETEPELRVLQTITIDAPDVIEGISAIWADIDNDGARDIIVTLSNNRGGSRIAAYREDGTLLAESDPIGLGHRWRHQIAVARFDGSGTPLLVSIRTPHIGGIVEFFQYKNGELEITNEIKGFSAHSIGSRNLDSALAGDFNNDGVPDLLAPDQSHSNLGIISNFDVIATLPLPDVLTSNLSATALSGKLYVGAGTHNNLKVWTP